MKRQSMTIKRSPTIETSDDIGLKCLAAEMLGIIEIRELSATVFIVSGLVVVVVVLVYRRIWPTRRIA